MTKRLEELFELPEIDDSNNEQHEQTDQSLEKAFEQDSQRVFEDLEEIESKLDKVTDLTSSDIEMDQLAKKAEDGYNDLMTLGMNVEPRFSAQIFDAASKMLGHAITAKSNKIDKKLRALDLKIKQRRLAVQEKQAGLLNDEISGEARQLDRNELMRIIREGNSKD